LQVELQFAPELNAMAPTARAETLAAADAICSFETYDFLHARDLDAAAIAGVMRRALSASRRLTHRARRKAGRPP